MIFSILFPSIYIFLNFCPYILAWDRSREPICKSSTIPRSLQCEHRCTAFPAVASGEKPIKFLFFYFSLSAVLFWNCLRLMKHDGIGSLVLHLCQKLITFKKALLLKTVYQCQLFQSSWLEIGTKEIHINTWTLHKKGIFEQFLLVNLF